MLGSDFAMIGGVTVGALAGYAGYALAMPFKTQATDGYWFNGTNYPAVTGLPGYTNTRAGAEAYPDGVGGFPSFAANIATLINGVGFYPHVALTNVLTNAGTTTNLLTQSFTTAATPYVLSFVGTGSVALSGSYTGTLAGTGASNRVTLVFTPTAASLTLTVTGTVQYAGLIACTHTNGGPIIATAGSAVSSGPSSMYNSANPLTVDQDFIWYAIANFNHPATAYEYLACMAAPGHYLARTTAGDLTYGNANIAESTLTPGATTGRMIVCARRRGGKDSVAIKVGSTVTVGVEGTVNAGFGAPANNMFAGENSSQTGQLNGVLEGIFVQKGTFSDAQVTSILQAA
jgi:hypothetical protein